MNHLPETPPSPATVVRGGPLTWIQQWHWFERGIPSPRRVNPTPLADHCRVPPPATVADVHRALADLTARHEALRTTVDPLRTLQHVHRADWSPLPVDHVEVPSADAATLEAATAALARCPIDPERNPPWLARVVLEAGKPRAVLVAVHHVVIDGWGLAVLLDRLHGLLRGDSAPPGPLTHPLDAVAAQSPERARAAEHEWLTRLASNPTGVLAPFGGTEGGGGRHRLQYRSVGAYDDLGRVARRHRASREVVMLAALAHDVAARTGEHRFLASVVVSNRARVALRNSVDVRALTVPVQIDLRSGAAFGEVVASVTAASAAAYRYGEWRPAELVAAQARADRRRGAVSVPTLEYNCYSWPRDYLVPARNAPPGGSTGWMRSTPDAPCDTLYVDLALDAGVLTLDVTVGDHLLDAEQTAALPVRLRGFLRAVADGAECPVPDRSLTPPASGWWRAPRGWVCLAGVEEVLRGHPGVLDATVTPGGDSEGEGPEGRDREVKGGEVKAGEGTDAERSDAERKAGERKAGEGKDRAREGGERQLVARVRVAPGVTVGDLHQHVLDRLDEVPGVMAPGRYVLSPEGPASGRPPCRTRPSRADSLRVPARPPATDAERALAAAVAAVIPGRRTPGASDSPGPGPVDMNRCLAEHGVTLVGVPRLLALLRQRGFTGIASDELTGTASLGHLAAALEPLPLRSPRAGGTPP
ncbi:condensation domain-containing protein [Streptomyces sp. NPDC094049]|uniref:condensation domain-containing protein n=1 Tax=Streptomyces sp. NPDC094049 TaxID=3154987 RepID=UPI00331D6A23